MIWLSVNRDVFMELPQETVRENSTSGLSSPVAGLPGEYHVGIRVLLQQLKMVALSCALFFNSFEHGPA
jgi:hypothetical protein